MKKSFILTCASAVTFFGCSWIVSAQGPVSSVKTGFGNLKDLIETFTNSVLAAVGTLLLSMGVVAFFYGIVMYIWGSRNGDPTAIGKGNTFMKWSLLALFVMFSIYGIIKFFQSTLCPTCDFSTITVPEIKFGRPSTSDGSGSDVGNNLVRQGEFTGSSVPNNIDPLGVGVTRVTTNIPAGNVPSASIKTIVPYGGTCAPTNSLLVCISGTKCTDVSDVSEGYVCLRPDEVVSPDF